MCGWLRRMLAVFDNPDFMSLIDRELNDCLESNWKLQDVIRPPRIDVVKGA